MLALEKNRQLPQLNYLQALGWLENHKPEINQFY